MVNGAISRVSTLEELRAQLAKVHDRQFTEIFLTAGEMYEDAALSALINDDSGWLMYLPGEDNPEGYSSRDPTYTGPHDAMMEFELSNGQVDEYPVRWTLPTEMVLRALEHYFKHNELPPWITWHNDALRDDYPWRDARHKE